MDCYCSFHSRLLEKFIIIMENNKSLMTLFRDFISILTEAEMAASLNSIDEFLIMQKIVKYT